MHMHPTKNDLPQETRGKVVQLLNERLADLITLQLQTKQAHWNVKGPDFISLHKLFDELAEEVRGFVDDVAERATALGGTAEGTPGVISTRTELPDYPLTISRGKDHVQALSTALGTAGKLVREAISQADKLGDAGTADLLTGISRELDKQLWFVEAHLQGE